MKSEDRAGLYITVIFHLVIIIILLACQIGAALRRDNTFVLDFSKQEEVEKQKAEENFKEEVSDRLDQLLAAASGVPIRNIAVDRSSALKDDRNTNAEQLYKDAERLAQELKDGFKSDEPDDDYVAVSKPVVKKEEPKKQTYSGPAYRCLGAGHVTVIITVDPSGNVIAAKIQEDASSNDKCLRDFAIRAARLSKFSASTSAPPRQLGNIVYMFIAQ